MQFLKTEGVILKTVPFREKDHIATLFTLDYGVIKVMSPRSSSFCAPLHRVEIIYTEGRGEMGRCRELSLLDPFSNLRKQLAHLEASCDLLNVIHSSQLVEKPAPMLYHLLLSYLDRIPFHTTSSAIGASFRLKILNHEGLITYPIPSDLTYFDDDEQVVLKRLAEGRHFASIISEPVAYDFMHKIDLFFEKSLEKDIAF